MPRFPAFVFAFFAVGIPLVSCPATAVAGIPFYTADAATLKAATRDAAVEALAGGYIVLLPEPFAEPAPAWDTRFKWRFSRAVYVFAPVRKGGRRGTPPAGLRLVTVIHHEPSDLTRAQQTARLIAKLLRLHFEHFGRDAVFPRDADTVEVWLAPETSPTNRQAGGETWDNQVYFFAMSAPRSPIEWTRTVAHEWGHLTMNAARGFTNPENDSGGFLGERLYLKWLRQEKTLDAPVGDGVTRAGLNLYHERQIQPLMDRFKRSGAAPGTLNRMDQDAMDLYIGGVLTSDAAYGSVLTGRALRAIEGVHPRDFFASLKAERQAAARAGRVKQKVSKK